MAGSTEDDEAMLVGSCGGAEHLLTDCSQSYGTRRPLRPGKVLLLLFHSVQHEKAVE